MLAVLRREMSNYFTSPIGYIFLAVFYFFSGMFFSSVLAYNSTDITNVFSGLFTVLIQIPQAHTDSLPHCSLNILLKMPLPLHTSEVPLTFFSFSYSFAFLKFLGTYLLNHVSIKVPFFTSEIKVKSSLRILTS